jgi:hypothetical protein
MIKKKKKIRTLEKYTINFISRVFRVKKVNVKVFCIKMAFFSLSSGFPQRIKKFKKRLLGSIED